MDSSWIVVWKTIVKLFADSGWHNDVLVRGAEKQGSTTKIKSATMSSTTEGSDGNKKITWIRGGSQLDSLIIFLVHCWWIWFPPHIFLATEDKKKCFLLVVGPLGGGGGKTPLTTKHAGPVNPHHLSIQYI